MSIEQVQIIILASIVAVSCALPGVFLVLRREALMSDAISHAVLFGIVIFFFLTKSLSSIWLILGASLTGLLTVSLTQLVIRTRKLKEDAAIGLVFPLLFSIGVVLISQLAKQVHIDADCVLFGEIAMAPFNHLIIGNIDFGVMGMWVMGIILSVNVAFIGLFYKELKLATFDPALAATMGFMPFWIHYALMSLVSITSVGAFEHVGSILVVAFMIVPACTAYLLTHRLSVMLVLSAVFAVLAACGGYGLAKYFDASIAGSMAVMTGIIFIGVYLFAPDKGLLASVTLRRFNRWDLATHTLAIHLWQSEVTNADTAESVVGHMQAHMNWDLKTTKEVIAKGIKDGIILKDNERLVLTSYGREKAKAIMQQS